jgi:hypothetical protein
MSRSALGKIERLMDRVGSAMLLVLGVASFGAAALLGA